MIRRFPPVLLLGPPDPILKPPVCGVEKLPEAAGAFGCQVPPNPLAGVPPKPPKLILAAGAGVPPKPKEGVAGAAALGAPTKELPPNPPGAAPKPCAPGAGPNEVIA